LFDLWPFVLLFACDTHVERADYREYHIDSLQAFVRTEKPDDKRVTAQPLY